MTEKPVLRFTCSKCKHREYEVGEMRVSGGAVSAMFDVENRKFTTVTCAHCRHTEFFQADMSRLASVFDFFTT